MFWGSAAFFDVAGRAGADDVLPVCFAAHASRDHVVERQFTRRVALAAELADVLVAGEDIAAVELDLVSRQAVVEQQPDDSRHGDMEMYRRDPVVAVRFELTPQLADLAPAIEIVIGIPALLERYDLGEIAKQKRKRPPDADDADRHIMPVEHQNVTVQTGFVFS